MTNGALPASTALAEATPDSLSEAIARFDRAVQAGTHGSSEAKKDLDSIITASRAQRTRWEAAAKESPVRGAKGAMKVPLGKKIAASLDDIGL